MAAKNPNEVGKRVVLDAAIWHAAHQLALKRKKTIQELATEAFAIF